jgi:hypothetical protein
MYFHVTTIQGQSIPKGRWDGAQPTFYESMYKQSFDEFLIRLHLVWHKVLGPAPQVLAVTHFSMKLPVICL